MTVAIAAVYAAMLVEVCAVSALTTRALLSTELTPAQIRAKAKRDRIRAMRKTV